VFNAFVDEYVLLLQLHDDTQIYGNTSTLCSEQSQHDVSVFVLLTETRSRLNGLNICKSPLHCKGNVLRLEIIHCSIITAARGTVSCDPAGLLVGSFVNARCDFSNTTRPIFMKFHQLAFERSRSKFKVNTENLPIVIARP